METWEEVVESLYMISSDVVRGESSRHATHS